MKVILSHISAARRLGIPNLDVVLGGAPGLGRADVSDITVLDGAQNIRRQGLRVHESKLPLPPGAVVAMDGANVASPELVFLQLAPMLDMQRLILLGLEICSCPPGQPDRALSTRQKLKAFLDKTPGHRGNKKSLRAAQFVGDGSGSVRESLAFMLLSLPPALGGYGLGGAALNGKIPLDEAGEELLSGNRDFASLYYADAKVAVDYRSRAASCPPAEQGRAILRASILERRGVGILQADPFLVYDPAAFRAFAFELARRLGRRPDLRAERFAQKHAALRSLLPERPARVLPHDFSPAPPRAFSPALSCALPLEAAGAERARG